MKKFVVGIDPGKNGGICSLTNGKITTVNTMPTSPEKLWEYFYFLGFPHQIEYGGNQVYVYIENVHSMPTDGSKSAFSFGYHLGQLDTIMGRLNITPNRVLPRTWMDSFGIKREKDETKYAFKKRILTIGQDKIPKSHNIKLDLKTCDAYLIAVYGYNQVKES